MSLRLPQSLAAWEQASFGKTFCAEVAALPHDALPLHRALKLGSHVVERPPQVMLLGREDGDGQLEVRAGVFFNSVLGGCHCADDPGPIEEHNEYCELRFMIERDTGLARVALD